MSGNGQGARTYLEEVIEHAAHRLPAQGPITVFIHHNTLHAFEDLSFDDGVKQGGRIFGCHPYLPEDRYRDSLKKGRIRLSDLPIVLRENLGERANESILKLCTRLELRLAMLEYPIRYAPASELLWFVAETDALRKFRIFAPDAARTKILGDTRRWVMRDLRSGAEGAGGTNRVPPALKVVLDRFRSSRIEDWSEETWEAFTLQALWRVCGDGVNHVPPAPAASPLPIRHRDLLFEATKVDSDPLVHELLIRLCAAFLDQGFSRWPLPNREHGFYRAFLSLYRGSFGPPASWKRGLAQEAIRLQDKKITAIQSIEESLQILGVEAAEWEPFIAETLLALRGWGGMVQQVEVRGDRAALPIPQGSLVEFLAVRLILDRFAIAFVAKETLHFRGPLRNLRDDLRQRTECLATPSNPEQRAFLVFHLAQVMGWSPQELNAIHRDEWTNLIQEIEAFSGLERRQIFHHAFERRFRIQTLDAVAIRAERKSHRSNPAKFQVACCLDDREESFRRHLEEVVPEVETFGVAGFFGVAMYYRGAADAYFVPLCPVVVRPQQWVSEQVVEDHAEIDRRRAQTRKAIGKVSHGFHTGSRTFAVGALLTAGLGVLASIPLIARVLFPRLTARIRRNFSRFVQHPPTTRLIVERREPTPGSEGGKIGFSLDEMLTNAEKLLRDIGLTQGFARLFLIIGHGSNSLNNPHKSAYDCGACGGSSGGPNARAMAQILNDHRVRAGLAERGISIPAETVFVGGFHNTCNDTVTFYDREQIPTTHLAELAIAERAMDATCNRNAHERSRRFMSAPLTQSFLAARQHVERRSEDMSQTRPECGHATNAICIVGRRSRNSGLYLDRRAFLVSYDPTQDDADFSILTRTLGAVFPVCAGINLEYYFSYIDSPGWGCGSKLPHNITSLLGVMDGAASDLRTGLPWQMVEIHEPLRLLFVIETTPEAIFLILEKNQGIRKLIKNGWVQVALLDPDSAQMKLFQNGEFVAYQPESTALPQVTSSVDWYRGWRDHLEFAEVVPPAEM